MRVGTAFRRDLDDRRTLHVQPRLARSGRRPGEVGVITRYALSFLIVSLRSAGRQDSAFTPQNQSL